jgi:hypothetical protein
MREKVKVRGRERKSDAHNSKANVYCYCSSLSLLASSGCPFQRLLLFIYLDDENTLGTIFC